MKEQKFDEGRNLLKIQKLQPFLELTGTIYPDLVKVFYTNMTFDGKNLNSKVKGVDMLITPAVWKSVTGLKNNGGNVGKGNTAKISELNKMYFYRTCLKDKSFCINQFHMGHLKLEERFLAYVVAC